MINLTIALTLVKGHKDQTLILIAYTFNRIQESPLPHSTWGSTNVK